MSSRILRCIKYTQPWDISLLQRYRQSLDVSSEDFSLSEVSSDEGLSFKIIKKRNSNEIQMKFKRINSQHAIYVYTHLTTQEANKANMFVFLAQNIYEEM